MVNDVIAAPVIVFITTNIIPEEGDGNPLQYSCLGNSRNKGAWRAAVRLS